MGKATVNDLLNEGFRKEQFGFSADTGWNDAGGVLATALLRAELWAMAKLGDANYAAATAGAATTVLKHCFHQLVTAETCYAASLLWRRRIAFLDSSAVSGLREGQPVDRLTMQKHAEAAEECATEALAEACGALGVDTASVLGGSGIALGHVETGRYPTHSPDAVTP